MYTLVYESLNLNSEFYNESADSKIVNQQLTLISIYWSLFYYAIIRATQFPLKLSIKLPFTAQIYGILLENLFSFISTFSHFNITRNLKSL